MICGQVWVPSGLQAGRSGTRRVNAPSYSLSHFSENWASVPKSNRNLLFHHRKVG